jgi:Glycosyltransferase family 87
VSLRTRLAAAVLLVSAAITMAHYTQVWAAIPPAQARTSDFAGTYVGATLWRSGSASAMYDVPAEEAVMARVGVPADHLYIPFENPPFAAVVASPFSLLDATTAYRAWSLLQLALLVAAVWVATRAAPWPRATPGLIKLAAAGVAIAGFGTGLLFVEGQWDGIQALGLALAYAGWRRGHRAAPGFAVGLTAAIAKPHLVAGVVAFMAGRRDWRGLLGAAAGASLVVVAGLLTAGAGPLAAFVRAVLEPSNSPVARLQGSTGLFGSLFGSGLGPFALAIVAGVAAASVAAWLGAVSRTRRDLLEPALAGATLLSLFASPHLLGHDLTLLAPVLVVTLAWTASREAASAHAWPGRATLLVVAGWVALSFATTFDLGQSSVGLPGRLTPWVLLALAALSGVAVRLAVMHEAHDAAGSHRLRVARHDADAAVRLEHA